MARALPKLHKVKPDTPLRLKVAAALAYPDGSMSPMGRASRGARLDGSRAVRLGAHTRQATSRYRRLSRYDEIELIWLLRGRPVLALTDSTAAVVSPTGAVTIYHRHNKPALGPHGDSLDDLTCPQT
jgi:hypothetical protein